MLLLAAVVSSSFVSYTMVLTLVPLFGLQLGASAGLIGLLTASIAFFPLLFAIRTGSLVDRLGAGRVLVFASLVLLVSPIAVVVSPSIPALFVTQIVVGIANLFAVVAGQAFTASLAAGRKREGNFGWYTTFVSAGQVVGPIAAGVTADAIGFVPAFALSGAVALVSVGSAWWLSRLPVSPSIQEAQEGGAHELRRAYALMAHRGVQFAMIVTFIVAFSQGAFTAFFPVILENAGYAAGSIGALLSLRAAVSMVLRPMLPWITGLLRDKRTALKVMLALMAGTFVALGLDQSLFTAVAVSLVMGLWWGVSPPLSIVMVVDGALENERGFALGVRLMANRLAQFVGPLSLGVVADLLTVRSGFYVGGGFVTLFLAFLMVRYAGDGPKPNESGTP
jgi:predicted MFS family arabinose efflux permease